MCKLFPNPGPSGVAEMERSGMQAIPLAPTAATPDLCYLLINSYPKYLLPDLHCSDCSIHSVPNNRKQDSSLRYFQITRQKMTLLQNKRSGRGIAVSLKHYHFRFNTRAVRAGMYSLRKFRTVLFSL